MPSGSDVIQRTDMKPAFSAHLLEPILQPANILQAWKRIMTEPRSDQYQPSPVRRVEIDKPDGGKRQLGIPTVTDRVIQQAIAQVLTPIFDPAFSNNSFGFRPHRNWQQAVTQVRDIIKTGRRFAVDVDLSKFFDRVDHDLLMTHLGYKVKDKRLLKLIKRYLRAGAIDNQLYVEGR
jgi:RNA-directed DNA polymerase